MRLQLLITQYKEDESVIKNLLCSLEIQQGIHLRDDVGVIIVNDGSDIILSEEFLNRYSFEIKYIVEKVNRGLALARNVCFDAATADYVMFCDADDMLYDALAIRRIFDQITKERPDVLVSKFVEELKDQVSGTYGYHIREYDSTFVHGKVLRRKFLEMHGIRYPQLMEHQDSFFNTLATRLATKVSYCDKPFYFWKWRDDSICRRDATHMQKTFQYMLDSNDALVGELKARGKMQDAAQCAVHMACYAYYTLMDESWWLANNAEYLKATEKRIKKYLTKYSDLILSAPINVRNTTMRQVKLQAIERGVFYERMTFKDWLNHIRNDVED